MENERVKELFLGLIFIVLLIIMILSFTNISADNSDKQGNIITNSYNTYNYGSDSYKKEDNYERGYLIYHEPKNYYYENRHYRDYDYLEQHKYMRNYYDDYDYYKNRYYNDHYGYDSKASHSRYYGLFDKEVNEYSVKVKNNKHEGDYYTVKFYLTDYGGKTRTESMTHYLNPHDSKTFTYKNVFNSGKEYHHWSYRVISP